LLSAAATLTGTFYLLGLDHLRPAFVALAYACVIGTLFRCSRGQEGWASPLCLILATALLRYTVPALMLEVAEAPSTPAKLMRLNPGSWQKGHEMALLAMSGFALGAITYLYLRRGTRNSVRPPSSHPGTAPSAIIGMAVGAVGVALFMDGNVNILAALKSGEFRSSTIQVGTGKYFVLGFTALAAACILSAHLEQKGRGWWVVLLPGLIALIIFFPLGGRMRAVGPLLGAFWLLWLRRGSGRVKLGTSAGIALATLFSLMLFHVGGAYRGGYGIAAFNESLSLSSLQGYAYHALWLDVGQLHALAAVSHMPGGDLGGRTFLALLWPLSQILALPETSAGMYVIEVLHVGGFSQTWGYHSGLVGDAFINFGVWGIPIVLGLFGVIVIAISDWHARGRLPTAFYILLVLYSLRIFSESVDKYKELFQIICLAAAVYAGGRLIIGSPAAPPGSVPLQDGRGGGPLTRSRPHRQTR
jgi:oligosaccharide repeat unit polymerase